MVVDLTRVPFFLFADTPEFLQALCFQNNATNMKRYDYVVMPPTPVETRWGVWFMASGEDYQAPQALKVVDRKNVEHG